MGRRLQDGAVALGALALAAAVIVAVDDGVRDSVTGIVQRTTAPGGFTAAVVHGQSAMHLFTKTVIDSGMEHAPLVAFGLAASMLVLFMLRT